MRWLDEEKNRRIDRIEIEIGCLTGIEIEATRLTGFEIEVSGRNWDRNFDIPIDDRLVNTYF